MKFKSAENKIRRARELIAEIANYLVTDPPYSYFLETNTTTLEKATFAKVNEESFDMIVTRCGDVIHNLRSALDHAYWQAVSPHVEEKNHKRIQFPFAKDIDNIHQTIKGSLGNDVSNMSNEFYSAIASVKPYAGKSGNVLLYLIHKINIEDKHKFPIAAGDLTKLSSARIRELVPDFPSNINMTNVSIFDSYATRVFVWRGFLFHPYFIGDAVPPTTYLFHKKLDIPVDIVFTFPELDIRTSIVETLKDMTNEVERVLSVMSESLTR